MSAYLPEKYLPRQVQCTLDKNKAFVLVGPRQVGKTTLAWKTLQPFMPDVLYLNMEDPLLKFSLDSPFAFAETFRARYGAVRAVFFDEIQHMQEAGLFVKGFVDSKPGVSVFVTGSSSFHLRSRTRESMAGRAIRKSLYPFSAREILKHLAPSSVPAQERTVMEVMIQQCVYGSYPEVYMTKDAIQKRSILSNLVEALILRDASDVFLIRRIDAFRRLLGLLAGQVGDLVNMSELASACGVDVGSISSYLEILEEAHVIHQTRPFAGGKRRELLSMPKVHFIDNGIRNQLLNDFSSDLESRTDKGKLFENWVFSELIKAVPIQGGIRYWRSKGGAEVDFVVERSNTLIGIEVKSGSVRKPTLSRSARSFIDAYQPRQFVVVNMQNSMETIIGDTQVLFVRVKDFLDWITNTIRDNGD
ncbi:MAG: ATP-binding protein [Desulfovermiculus sp.]|nr:ATP-binding protein [Desulfovermiculus sp.]